MILVIPWEAIVVMPGLGTVSRAAGLVVAATWALTVLATGRLRKLQMFHVIVFAFFLWNAMSIFWSIDPDLTLTRLRTFVQMAGFTFVLWDLYSTSTKVEAGLQAYVLGACVSVGSVIINYLSDVQYGIGRYSATGFNSGEIGMILALGIPVAWHLASSESNCRKSRALRFVNYAYIPASTFAILLTGTRSAMLMTLPGFLFGISTTAQLKPGPRILILVGLCAGFLTLASFIPQASVQRLESITDEVFTGDLSGRTTIWGDGLEALVEHPFLGVGANAFFTAIESGRSAHNTFLAIAVELGIIGLLLFGVILAMALYQVWQHSKWDFRFWLTLFVVWSIGNLAITWSHSKVTWLFLNLMVASAAASRPPDESPRANAGPFVGPG